MIECCHYFCNRFVIEMTVSSFISIDPITALHMGLSRDTSVIERARKHADILESLQTSSPDPQRLSRNPPIHGDSLTAASLSRGYPLP